MIKDYRKSFSPSTVLTVSFPSERATKKMVFELNMKAQEAKSFIIEKRNSTVPLLLNSTVEDYGLFIPPSGNLPPEWMKETDPLNFYHIEERGLVEFKLKPQPLLVRFDTGSEKLFFVDFECPVANLIPKIITNLNLSLSSLHDYYLTSPSDFALSPNKSLIEQEIPFKSLVLLKRGYKNKRKSNKQSKVEKKVSLTSKQFSKVFGVSMNDLLKAMSLSAHHTITIVPFIEKCIDYIEKNALDLEGIFRISGSLNEIQTLKANIDNGEDVDIDKIKDPHVVSGLLKLYLRELPEPLMTFQLYYPFIYAESCKDPVTRLRYFKALIKELPEENRMLLQRLLTMMKRISENREKNLMSTSNLATCFAPNLLKSDNNSINIEETSIKNNVISLLIENEEILFENTPQEYKGIAKSIYEFRRTQPNCDYELEFSAGAIIYITIEDESGWWTGDCDGKIGVFPHNYVELLMMFGSSNNQQNIPASLPNPFPNVQETSKISSTPIQINTESSSNFSVPTSLTTETSSNFSTSSSVTTKTFSNPTEIPSSKSTAEITTEEWEKIQVFFETEKAKRIELEILANSLQETVNELKSEIANLKISNEALISKLTFK